MRSLADHIADPRPGRPPNNAVTGCAGGSCGDTVTFMLDVREGLIVDAAARIRGRQITAGLASAFVERITGTTITDAARVGLHDMSDEVAALDADDRERAGIVEDALHHAIGNEVLRAAAAATTITDLTYDVIAMSGGVDSAVALHDGASDGDRPVIGATLRLWIDPQAPDPDSACCAPDSVRRARRTCHQAGVGHLSLDLRDAFAARIVAPFLGAYGDGDTPNPCVSCNGEFRLDGLVQVADALGGGNVHTGHYVRRVERDGRWLLQRGLDSSKDQSYMLASVAPATVERYRFPLGEQTKDVTRARASDLQLEQATTPDSQEICFLGGATYTSFLDRAGKLGTPGDIMTVDGTVVGSHDGIARFTPGQRRGLGLGDHAGSEPLYVIATDPATGTVTVGPRDMLECRAVDLSDLVWHDDNVHEQVYAQLRYRSTSTPATVEISDEPLLVLHDSVQVPAPGQVACLYDDDGVVIGTAQIARSSTGA